MLVDDFKAPYIMDYKLPFLIHQARDIYWLMPPVFKEHVPFAAVMCGVQDDVPYDLKEYFEVARYLNGTGNSLYPLYCGRLMRSIVERFEPLLAAAREAEVSEELRAYYWEQMYNLRYTLVYKDEEISNYDINNVSDVVDGNDKACLEIGRKVLSKYDEGNGIPCNLLLVTYGYSAICNITHFFWVLTQLEPITTIDAELLDKFGIKE